MNILVTGGAGFIGSHLCDALTARGDRVVVLDNFDPFYDPAIKRANAARLSATLIEGDITRGEDVEKAFAAVGQGAHVVHLAARGGVRPSIQDPVTYARINVEGTTRMLEGAVKAKARGFVFASSSSVYGARSNPPFAEDDRTDSPASPYAATKRAGELLCSAWSHVHGLPCVALRFFTVYGPRQRPDLAIAKFCALIRAGEKVPFFGDGTTARDYTFVEDTVRGILAAIDRPPATFEAINLGGARPVSLRELVAALEQACGRKAVLDPQPPQAGDVPLTCASTEKARRLLGFEARVSLDDGLKRYVAWLNGG